MEQDVQVQEQTEIQVIARNINKGLEAFETRKAELTKLKEDAAGLTIDSIDDKTAINQVSTWRKKLKSARVEIQKEGKAMRDPLTRISKSISSKEDELIDIISPTEKDLQAKEDWVKAEQDKIDQAEARRKQELIQVRIDKLRAFGYEIDLTFLTAISEEDFEKVLDSARIEFEKEEAAKAEKAQQEQLQREQDEKDRAELKALREKQEAADKILREREAENARKEQERVQREEDDRIMAEKKLEKEMKDARFEPRKAQLLGMGFTTCGIPSFPDFSLQDTWSTYWEQVYNMEDKEWPEYINDISNAIERREVRLAEEEKKKAIDLENARLKGIADEKKRVQDEADKKQKQLEEAGDKAVWADFISKLKALPVPSMNSSQYRRMSGATRQLLIQIYELKP